MYINSNFVLVMQVMHLINCKDHTGKCFCYLLFYFFMKIACINRFFRELQSFCNYKY